MLIILISFTTHFRMLIKCSYIYVKCRICLTQSMLYTFRVFFALYAVVDCGVPPLIENGQFVIINGTTYLSKVAYVCNTGYILTGVAFRSCQADGTWSSEEPSCESRSLYDILTFILRSQYYMYTIYYFSS